MATDLAPLLTTADVARILDRKPRSVVALIKAKKLAARNDGGRWLITEADLRTYIDSLEASKLRPSPLPEPDSEPKRTRYRRRR